ncbi:MAG: hypothetical protein BIFFINMI_04105 [Phycisphaerae bacterium]|nr:hypothetical protein [Phycisphaerae bacterium]
MASTSAVWGIDVGQCALKALRVQLSPEGNVEVTHFDIIEHPKILSQPDADADQLVRNALDKFLSRNDITGCKVALSVPGQSSFARFIKLPPVERKRVPEIVQFEAVQQIPFDIEEVEWDYQIFESPTSPDLEVGIFAMRKELVLQHLANFTMQGIEAEIVQLAPLALYNMMAYDQQVANKGATILIDVGAENTDLVISDGDRIWLRSIPTGGNNFTESLVKAFKLSFSKAENLKRTAATSKYARQIFVAMRPVFGDLVSEVQRSIGFYTSLNRDAEITRVLCLGNAFRLPGLQKYLEQNLNTETVRLNAFNRLKPTDTINAPAFTENVLSFGVAYGLGLQGLGQAPIQSNLLPFTIVRQRNWRAKRPWFAASAAVMALGLGVASYSAASANRKINQSLEDQNGAYQTAQRVLAANKKIQAQVGELKRAQGNEEDEINDIKKIIAYRPTMLLVYSAVQKAAPRDWEGVLRRQVAQSKGINPGDTMAMENAARQLDWRRDLLPWLRQESNRALIPFFQLEHVDVEYSPAPMPPPTVGSQGASSPRAVTPTPTPVPTAAPGTEPVFYLRVNITGTMNVKNKNMAPEELKKGFLSAIVAAFDPAGKDHDPLLDDYTLVDKATDRWVVDKVDYVLPEEQWPKPAEPGVGGGPAPAGIPSAQPAAPGGSTDVLGLPNYKDTRFHVAFDLKVRAPGSKRPANESEGAAKPNVR